MEVGHLQREEMSLNTIIFPVENKPNHGVPEDKDMTEETSFTLSSALEDGIYSWFVEIDRPEAVAKELIESNPVDNSFLLSNNFHTGEAEQTVHVAPKDSSPSEWKSNPSGQPPSQHTVVSYYRPTSIFKQSKSRKLFDGDRKRFKHKKIQHRKHVAISKNKVVHLTPQANNYLKWQPNLGGGHEGTLQNELIFNGPAPSERPNAYDTCAVEEDRKKLLCLGFPNLEQTCYINSTLQGLLTLTHFVEQVQNQQEVCCYCPNSDILSGLVRVGDCRSSNNIIEKTCVLTSFKKIIAEFNPEFEDDLQKDAHEFLSCVLNTIRSLTLELKMAAHVMGRSYSCPVEANIVFRMLNTRRCTGCGVTSAKEEEYINLSLDLVPGGTVSDCLEEYLKETQLEYKCECGGGMSMQQFVFSTLPNVLILQLKRFTFTPTYTQMKLNHPVLLLRDLEVNLNSSAGQNPEVCYSLVSIISHLGSRTQYGHYICDGVQRDSSGGLTDNWLTYDDSLVWQSTGTSVCKQRQRTAYLLFYEDLNGRKL
ncbi:ubiquitin carboxyl-terminal hydrolase 37-like [Cynoglossus semilaevis]|uniref:Ubiquitin carboxyl-terminal hydrolase 37-like n=1 Tax=Cynoglossus semilaevis TaxID=244447 RepID=A0A3P8UFD5_CYNSE|nr:ubiquitin carboxyl-terminal hydrolase 37-like [Cynoglossus semilaevis]